MDERTKALLKRATDIVSHPAASDSTRLEAIILAYEVGLADGRVEGMREMQSALFPAQEKQAKSA